MSKWEYCQIVSFSSVVDEAELLELRAKGFKGEVSAEENIFGSTTIARAGTLRFFSQPRETREFFTDLAEVVTRLGLDGWELVSQAVSGGVTQLYFKRQLPDS